MLRRPRSGLDMRPIIVLVVMALCLTIWQHRARASASMSNTSASFPERIAVSLVWPLQRQLASLNRIIESVGTGLGQYRKLAEENQQLKAEVDKLTTERLRLTDVYFENQRLKRQLGYVEQAPGRPLVAKVVGMNYGLSLKRLTIMAPPDRQMQVGDIVRTEAGLVGRITDVRGNRADVFLLIDGQHAVAGIIARSRDQGMVRVDPQPNYLPDMLVMDKLMGRANIREGDVVMTSGMGEVYPPGIPIGTVVSLRRSSSGTMDVAALIRPRADFDHLSYVLVERYAK